MNELIQFCKVRCYDEEVSIEVTSHSLRIKVSSVVGKTFFTVCTDGSSTDSTQVKC